MKIFPLLLLFLFSISCNKTKVTETKKKIPRQNIALVVDASLSMLSKDFKPNRITTVKETLERIITFKEDYQAFSIVIFAGNSYLSCPLTTDKRQLLTAVNKISDSTIFKLKLGTSFSHALLNGLYSLKKEKSNKSILIFSDGFPATVNSYPLDIAIEEAVKNSIPINAIIISPKDFMISPTSIDENGKMIYSKIKVSPLDSIFFKTAFLKTNGNATNFHTKKELDNFDFKKFLSQIKTKETAHKSYSSADIDKMNKIYNAIKLSNDSLSIRLK